MLDEVTTHLDADSIVALAGALNAYAGAVLVVSHDRFFVRAVVEGAAPLGDADSDWDDERAGDVWMLENGRLAALPGGVAEYAKRAAREVRKSRAPA